jgi:hypothetical protein
VVRTVCMERNMCYRGWHQCLVVGCRKYTLWVITEGKGFKEGACNEGTGGCGSDCAAESEPHGTATLLRCTLSAVVKSLSKEYLLHKYLLRSILEESIVQVIATCPVHTTAL